MRGLQLGLYAVKQVDDIYLSVCSGPSSFGSFQLNLISPFTPCVFATSSIYRRAATPMAAAAPNRPPAPLRATAPAVEAVTPLVVLVGGLFVP